MNAKISLWLRCRLIIQTVALAEIDRMNKIMTKNSLRKKKG